MPGTTNNTHTLVFVFIAVMLYSIGLGIIFPVLPKLIMEVTGLPVGAAAVYSGWLAFAYAFIQLLCAPVTGNLSDRFGRRPILLSSLIAFGADYILMGWAPSIGWLFLGRIIAGAAASTHSVANAFVADISPAEKRPQNFGLLGAAFGVGFVVGPVIGGFLGVLGPRVPFFAAGGLALLNFIYGYFVLPESLLEENRRPFQLTRANPFGAFRELFKHPVILWLAGAIFLHRMAHQALPSIWAYFTMEKFAWTEREIGYSLGVVGLLYVFVSGYLTRLAIPRLGPIKVGYIGLIGIAGSFIGYALSPTPWLIYVFLVTGGLQAFIAPAITGIMSRRLPANVQGELQGILASIGSLTSILSPPLMTQIFNFFTDKNGVYFPGAPFFAAAIMATGGLIIFATVTSQEAYVRETEAGAGVPQ
jgi:DHA1 family tetracycline resistance protein-like MFS transporter